MENRRPRAYGELQGPEPRRTRGTEDRDSERSTAQRLADDTLHACTRAGVKLAPEEARLATPVGDLIARPVDWAEGERRRVRERSVKIIVRRQQVGLREAVPATMTAGGAVRAERQRASKEEDEEEDREEGNEARREAWRARVASEAGGTRRMKNCRDVVSFNGLGDMGQPLLRPAGRRRMLWLQAAKIPIWGGRRADRPWLSREGLAEDEEVAPKNVPSRPKKDGLFLPLSVEEEVPYGLVSRDMPAKTLSKNEVRWALLLGGRLLLGEAGAARVEAGWVGRLAVAVVGEVRRRRV